MSSASQQAPASKVMHWIGWVLTILPVLMLLMSATMKFLKPEGMKELAYEESVALPLGIVELICAILYVFPRTSVLGAILLTGYLGGAVATQVRAGQGAFAILFPVVFGVLLWAGLALRDDRLRRLIAQRD